MKTKPITKHTFGKLHTGFNIFLAIVFTICVLCKLSASWYIATYGQMGFSAVLYTMLSNLNGVQSGLISSYLHYTLPRLLAYILAVLILVLLQPKKRLVLTLFSKLRIPLYPLPKTVISFVSIILACTFFSQACTMMQIPEYISALRQNSTFYEDYYQDPRDVQITFPEQKRNLIYIFMESMETTYQSYDLGGSREVNLIPELTRLSQEHVSFSTSDQFSGAYQMGATGWTIAAMLSQSSGVPLVMPPGYTGNDYGQDGYFLPGLYTLSNLLHDNGYYQMLMVGSDAAFGGRKSYYSSHKTDRIYDYFDACASGLLPSEDYYVWWGIEDLYLYECAKTELLNLAQQDQPFAFTMLTVDTHHIDGYLCAKCGNEHEEQYENVISCASRQVAEFVAWLQQQDFYENTTVIICGDHLSMDNAYFIRQNYNHSLRATYNCFINAPLMPVSTKNRSFTSMDMFPTTVAALGCTIENNRLGLGTNLFSSVPTLCEELGNSVYIGELAKSTNYYFEHFFFS